MISDINMRGDEKNGYRKSNQKLKYIRKKLKVLIAVNDVSAEISRQTQLVPSDKIKLLNISHEYIYTNDIKRQKEILEEILDIFDIYSRADNSRQEIKNELQNLSGISF